MRNGTLTTVESVVIMYGAITFACFQTGGVYLTSARKAGLSLVTSDLAPDTKPSFALEDVPITPTVGGGGGGGGGHTSSGKRNAHDDASPPNKRFKEMPPVLPRLQTSAASPNRGSASPRAMDMHQNGGRMFGSRLDVDSITAGGISPTVASASAILGSLGGDAQGPDASAQQRQQQQQQQQQQRSGPSSYAAFYNAQTPQHFDPTGGHPSSFYPGTRSPYGQPYSLPHPLSQSHSGYMPAAPQSPHEPAGVNAGMYPPTSQPFDHHHQQQQQQQTHNAFAPASSSPDSAFPPQLSRADDGAGEGSAADASAAAAANAPAAPASPAGGKKAKKPPKQRPDGPVYKPNQKACESCGTVNSPEWRKGPTGAKSLCNACGASTDHLGSPLCLERAC